MFGTLLTTISKFQSEAATARARKGVRMREVVEEKVRSKVERVGAGLGRGREWREWEVESVSWGFLGLPGLFGGFVGAVADGW